MINKWLLFFSAAFILACGNDVEQDGQQEKDQDKVELNTLEDKVSYSLGLDRASEIQNILVSNKLNDKFDTKDIEEGMIAVFSGEKELPFTEKEANQVISSYMSNQTDESAKKDAGIAIGMMDALSVKNSLGRKGIFENLDSKLMERGVIDGFENTDNLLIPVDETKEIIMGYFGDIYKKEGAEFLAKNKKKEGIKVTESGLQYEVLKEGNSDKQPTIDDQVTVHYTGMLIDGTVFDSSHERNEPTTFPVSGVIRGWVEGLQLMELGSKYKFYIPQDLAYGQNPPPGSTIHPFATLVFEVELLEIK